MINRSNRQRERLNDSQRERQTNRETDRTTNGKLDSESYQSLELKLKPINSKLRGHKNSYLYFVLNCISSDCACVQCENSLKANCSCFSHLYKKSILRLPNKLNRFEISDLRDCLQSRATFLKWGITTSDSNIIFTFFN